MSPLLVRLWREYEAGNRAANMTYDLEQGRMRQVRDQAGRGRKTKQAR